MIRLERIHLRRPVDYDAEDLLALARDREVERWNPIREVSDLESARAWCRRSADWSVGEHATWVAVDAGSDALIATCAIFNIVADDATAAIGYRVAQRARGMGVARSCVESVTRWAFAEYRLARIQLSHAVDNEASCRVAQATGYAFEGTLRSAYVDVRGMRHDEHLHARLAADAGPETAVLLTLRP